MKAVIVVADFYPRISGLLLDGCEKTLRLEGLSDITVEKVGGAMEIPLALQLLGKKNVSLMAALGCVIRGDTYHFEVVCDIVARGILQVQLTKNMPVGNGVLTAENEQQALARVEKGADAARAALLLARLKNRR